MTNRNPTGISGLDELIEGGFPENTVNLVSGPAGSAKSLLAIQYVYNGAVNGEPGVYITLEESRTSIIRAMTNYGMDIEKYENDGKLYILDMGEIRRQCQTEEMEEGMVGFRALQTLLNSLLDHSKARRLSIDSVTAIGLYYDESPGKLRREMFHFAGFLRSKNVTSLLITESIENGGLTRYGIEQFISDSFVVLGLEEIKGELRRTATVRKMRFTKHDTAKHPMLITSSGINIQADSKVF